MALHAGLRSKRLTENCDNSINVQATEGVLDWVPFNMFLSVLSLLGPEPVPERAGGERGERGLMAQST